MKSKQNFQASDLQNFQTVSISKNQQTSLKGGWLGTEDGVDN